MGIKRVGFLLVSGIVIMLTACGMETDLQKESLSNNQIERLEKLGDISVVSREPGSGTRSTFAQMVGFDTGNNDSDRQDLTKEGAQLANNAEEVIREIENNPSSIGYVSKAFLTEESKVKVLNINGIDVDSEGGGYPLNRSFYLAYCGKLTDLEQDFLTYIHSAGQEIVAQSFVPVAKSNTFLSNREKGKITVTGSTSVAPLMEELADAYMKINTNAEIEITATDSSMGLTSAMSGESDFAMSSRQLKDYEKELLDYEVIANDDIVVIVNELNPLQDITLSQLKDVYMGNDEQWKELTKE